MFEINLMNEFELLKYIKVCVAKMNMRLTKFFTLYTNTNKCIIFICIHLVHFLYEKGLMSPGLVLNFALTNDLI